MARRPIVISPITPLLRQEAVDIALVSVELWPTETIVRLAALVDDPPTEEARYGGQLDAWARAGRRGPLPQSRGDRLFEHIVIGLSDDVGTTYTYNTKSVGGSGRTFRADWHFPVGVPDAAERLALVASNEQTGESATTELRL